MKNKQLTHIEIEKENKKKKQKGREEEGGEKGEAKER